VALVIGALVHATPASAESTAPTVTSFSRLSPAVVQPEDGIRLRVSAHDNGGSGVQWLAVTYLGPHGHRADARAGADNAADATETLSATLTRWQASGAYLADELIVRDGHDNATSYFRDGTTRSDPSGITGTHSFDLRALDFAVDNSAEDVTAPTLSNVRVLQSGGISAGDPVIVTYDAHDEGSGVVDVYARALGDTSGQSLPMSAPDGLAAAGPLTTLLPLAQGGGHYTSDSLIVTDAAGNYTFYDPDGWFDSTTGVWSNARTTAAAGQVSFTVIGGQEDVTAPRATSLSLSSPSTRRSGQRVSIVVGTSDAGTGVGMVEAQFVDANGHSLWAHRSCGAMNPAIVSFDLTSKLDPGPLRLSTLIVRDSFGNVTFYASDGTSNSEPGGPGTHTLPFGAVTTTITRGVGEESSTPSSSETVCDSTPQVSADPSLDTATPGQSVTVSGRVSTTKATVAAPMVATYAITSGTARLLTLGPGSATGTFAASTTLTRTTTFRSVFFGSNRRAALPAAQSAGSTVLVGSRQSLARGKATMRGRVGATATLRATLAPARGAVLVALAKRNAAGRYHVVSTVRSDRSGHVSARVKFRPKRTVYRWSVAYGGGYLPAASRTIVVKRR
jgi:hypothetical protein